MCEPVKDSRRNTVRIDKKRKPKEAKEDWRIEGGELEGKEEENKGKLDESNMIYWNLEEGSLVNLESIVPNKFILKTMTLLFRITSWGK